MTADMKAKFSPNNIFHIDNPTQLFNEVVPDASTNPRTCIYFVRHKYPAIFLRAELGFQAAPVSRIIDVGAINRTTSGVSSQIVRAIKNHKELERVVISFVDLRNKNGKADHWGWKWCFGFKGRKDKK